MAIKRGSTRSKGNSKKGSKKPAGRSASPARKPAGKRSKSAAARRTGGVETGAVEVNKLGGISTIPESARLLRHSKTTTAALNLLEKAIRLIYHKEFKKARSELKSLLETYQNEPEILARARTYMQICHREEGTHKKTVVGNDQLYTLGVMEHNRGDFEKAISYFRQSLERNPDSDHIFYSMAASYALKGDVTEAVHYLQRAVELNEENRVFAKNDADFTALHGRKEFGDLVGWEQPAPGE